MALVTYADLLAHGCAFSPPGADADEWRSAIRREARADKIRVRTGTVNGRAWALNLEHHEAVARAYDAWSDAGDDEAARERATEDLHALGCGTPPEVLARVDALRDPLA